VESLEKSLANSPVERNQDWGFSPRGQETHRNRFGEEVYGRNRDGGKGFDGLRDLDDVLPNGRQVDPTRVMVSGISWQMSAHQIREELVHRCSKLGKVVDIEVAQYRGNSPSQLDRGRHRGFAFVTMETPEQATLVMTALHKMDMGGMQVQTKPGVVKDPMFARRNYAKKKAEDVVHKPTGRKYVKVFVGNLWFGTDGERLRDAFQEYGLIVDTKVVRDKDSGESRGFGFVTFANESSAVEAIGARDGSLLDGRKLVVNVSRSWAGSNGEEESGSEGTPSEFSHDRH
jgi:RNA recognition motif-containing protein